MISRWISDHNFASFASTIRFRVYVDNSLLLSSAHFDLELYLKSEITQKNLFWEMKLHSFILYHFHECYRFWTKLKQIISCYYVPSWYRSKIKNNKYIGSRVNFIFKTESNIHLSLCISLHHAYQIWKKVYVYYLCMLKSFIDEKSIKKLTIIINSNGKYWDHIINNYKFFFLF